MKRIVLTAALTVLLLGQTSLLLAQDLPIAPPPAAAPPEVPPIPFLPSVPLPAGDGTVSLFTMSDQDDAEKDALASASAKLADAAAQMQNFSIYSGSPLPKTPISLKVRDSKISDALKQALEQAKVDYVLDSDIPDDPKVTLEIQNVRIDAVLDLLTENGGVGWKTETKNDKTIVHVGKKVKRSASFDGLTQSLGGLKRLYVSRDDMKNPFVYSVHTSETRSTFTCSNCHNQITIVKKNVEAKCPTCGRVFEPNWKVCPYDGTARPVAQDTWKYCPICAFPIPPTAAAPVTQAVPVTSVTVTSKETTTAPPAPATAPPAPATKP